MYIIFFLLISVSALELKVIKQPSECIEDCIREIIFENDIRTSVSFTTKSLSFNIDGILNRFHVPSYSIALGTNEKFLLVNEGKTEQAQLYFIHVTYFRHILPRLKATGLWKHRHKLVVFTEHADENILEIFHYFLRHTNDKAYNIAIISLNTSTLTISGVFTRDPFNGELKKHTRCKNIFPIYSKNMNKLYLNVSIMESPVTTWSGGRYTGTPGFIADSLAETMNATIRYIRTTDIQRYGGDEPPLKGTIGDISSGVSNVGLNGRFLTAKLHKDKLDMLIEYTYPRTIESITVLMPVKPTNIILKLSSYWVVTFMMLCSTFIIFRYAKVMKIRVPFLDTLFISLTIFTMQSISQSKMKLLRPILLIISFISITVTTWWTTDLASELTAPKQHRPLKTLEDLAFKTSYEIKLTNRILTHVEDILESNIFLSLKPRLNSTNLYDGIALLREIKFCTSIGFVVKKRTAEYIHRIQHALSKHCYEMLKESVMPAWDVLPVTFGSPYLPQIDKLLSRMFESGLDVFSSGYHYTQLKNFGQQHVNRLSTKFLEPLSTYIVITGHAISTFVFILELIWHRYRNQQRYYMLRVVPDHR